ncbi:MAG: nucleoside hydrolase [Bacteroidetes bacterium]|nr:MAG: nucleoside hydrolase [Bacteroidota bacterium]
MKPTPLILIFIALHSCILASAGPNPGGDKRIPVILDSDANNELDDQFAIAYILLNEAVFDVRGITVNATFSGGGIDQHLKEAGRIMELCGWKGKAPLKPGAGKSFPEIVETIDQPGFDGEAAVDFIIEEALKPRSSPLVFIPVGKLTNIALALKKAPEIANRLRVVWLGSNYPEPGEYNQINDTTALNFILNTEVPFEIVTVRPGKASGTHAVKIRRKEVFFRLPGLGPYQEEAVMGRHGNAFNSFGDYAVDLFRNIEYLEEGCYRSLFDVAAVAIVKDASWASVVEIPAPILVNGEWVERPSNKREIKIWEYFDRDAIISDFFAVLEANTAP